MLMFCDIGSDTDKPADIFVFYQTRHFPVQLIHLSATLFEVRQYDSFLFMMFLLFKEIQCYIQWFNIQAVAVVDHRTVVYAFLEFEPHSNRS